MPPTIEESRAALGAALKRTALGLARTAIELRHPLTLVVDSRMAEAVRAVHQASQELFDVAIDVLHGRTQVRVDAGTPAAEADPYPLITAAERRPAARPPEASGPEPEPPARCPDCGGLAGRPYGARKANSRRACHFGPDGTARAMKVPPEEVRRKREHPPEAQAIPGPDRPAEEPGPGEIRPDAAEEHPDLHGYLVLHGPVGGPFERVCRVEATGMKAAAEAARARVDWQVVNFPEGLRIDAWDGSSARIARDGEWLTDLHPEARDGESIRGDGRDQVPDACPEGTPRAYEALYRSVDGTIKHERFLRATNLRVAEAFLERWRSLRRANLAGWRFEIRPVAAEKPAKVAKKQAKADRALAAELARDDAKAQARVEIRPPDPEPEPAVGQEVA